MSVRQLLRSCFHLRKIRKYLDRMEEKPLESDAHAVLYALHYEPEASFMNRVDYDSQLYNIKMIAASLPPGWVLYVKEHPHQLHLFTSGKFDALKCIDQYRDIFFYKQILKNQNVKLIKRSISSETVLNAPWVHGVISINGTVGLEALAANKHAVLLDGESAVYGQVSRIRKVYDAEDLKIEIKRMEEQKPKDANQDMHLIANHVYAKNLLHGNVWDIPESILLQTLCGYRKYVK